MRGIGAAVGVGLALAALAAGPARRPASCRSTSGSTTAARSRRGRGPRCSGSRTGGSTPRAGTSRARWAASSRRRSSCSTRVSFGVDGEWIGKATRFTSGAGYVRYDLRRTAGSTSQRTDVAPDGARGALLGLELTQPGAPARARSRVQVDAHSELMVAVPVGLRRHHPQRERQRARHRRVRRAAGWSSATPGSCRARPRRTPTPRWSAPIATPVRGEVGPGHYGPNGTGRTCAPTQTPAPMPKRVRRRPVRQGHRRPAALQRQAARPARGDAVDRRRRVGRVAGRRARASCAG